MKVVGLAAMAGIPTEKKAPRLLQSGKLNESDAV
jgi:hypothetical protein